MNKEIKNDIKKLKDSGYILYGEKFPNSVDWNSISRCRCLSIEFLKKYKEKLNWDLLSEYFIFNNEELEYFKDMIDFEICLSNNMTRRIYIVEKILIDKPLNEIKSFLKNQYISCKELDILSKRFDKECWDIISRHQCLYPDFAKEFKDFINWKIVFEKKIIYPEIVDVFLRFFKVNNDQGVYIYNQNFSEEVIRKYLYDFDPCRLLITQDLPENLLRDYLQNIKIQDKIKYHINRMRQKNGKSFIPFKFKNEKTIFDIIDL